MFFVPSTPVVAEPELPDPPELPELPDPPEDEEELPDREIPAAVQPSIKAASRRPSAPLLRPGKRTLLTFARLFALDLESVHCRRGYPTRYTTASHNTVGGLVELDVLDEACEAGVDRHEVIGAADTFLVVGACLALLVHAGDHSAGGVARTTLREGGYGVEEREVC